MDFSLSEEQILLRDSVEKYVADNCDVARHRALVEKGAGFDPLQWEQFAQLGWLSVPFTEEYGGFGGGAADVMVVAQALGGALVREPFLTTVVLCGGVLNAAGSEAQKAAMIPSIIDGSAQWALAFAEDNSTYELHAVSSTATGSGEGYVLNGKKMAVLNGDAAGHLIVSANTDSGLALFVVDASAPGVSVEPFAVVDGSQGADITFDSVSLAGDALLGVAGEGAATLRTVIDQAIVAMGADALGAMKSLLNETVQYTKTREQFGQPIGKFQALQHDMADMYLKVEETQSLVLNAAIALDENSPESSLACAALKVKFSEAGMLVAKQAIQLHGGIGMTDELVVGHHYKRILLLSKLFGDADYYVQRYAELDAAARAA
ncbi:MAG: acyl-CoA dehydrogenase family protein [Halioglobus sp.]